MKKNLSKIVLPNSTEQITYDENGQMIARKFFKGSSNGKGWCIVYTEKVTDLICRCPSATTIKVFMLLAMGQQFDNRGMVTTKKAVQEKLGITKPTCLEAFKWLKENFIINEYRNEGGYTEFMVNPEYVTVGKDKKQRVKEWIRRWSEQTVLSLPADGAPIAGIVEPKPLKEKKKQKRAVTFD